MQKILLGIVAIFCLQATFQAYLAVEQSHAEYLAMTHATPLNDSLGDFAVETASLEEQQIPAVSDAVKRVISPRRTARPLFQPAYAADRKPLVTGFKRIPEMTEARSFRTITIGIPGPVRYKTASYVREQVAIVPAAHKKEKKSLPAKTFAIIKKPYGWLKAFASKFKG